MRCNLNNQLIPQFFCGNNLDLSGGINYMRIANEFVYPANAIWTLNNAIMKNSKNRFEADGKSYNLTAYLRNYKIDQILED